MSNKVLVLVDSNLALDKLKPVVKVFESIEDQEAQDFINKKTAAGFSCHVFNYMESYKTQATLTKFTNEKYYGN